MRTRFLNIDYFSSCSSSSSSVETLTIVELPVPDLATPRLFNVEEDFDGCEDVAPFSLEIGKLPIEAALSRFIAEVVPQFVDTADFGDVWCGEDKQGSIGELRSFVFVSDRNTLLEKEEDGSFVADESIEAHEVIMFEAPEVDAFLGERHSFVEGLQSLSEVSYTEKKLDLPIPGLPMQPYNKIKESIYSVGDVSLEYDINQMPYACEDDGSMQGRTSSNHDLFPTLEVHETNLRPITGCFKEHQFLSLLESMETQSASTEMEAFGSVKCDIFEAPSDHCLSKDCINSEVTSSDSILLVDDITIVDTICHQEGSAVCSLPTEPITFEELVFVWTPLSQLCDIFFNMQKSLESENCDLMTQKELNFRNLNDLVVSSELALIDGTFRTMPAPILSDQDRIKSMYTILEEVLTELKEQPLSASNDIYLDWHFLYGDLCNCKIGCRSIHGLEDLDSHTRKLDMEFSDDGKPILDFILSDFTLFKTDEHQESLIILPEGLPGSSSMCPGGKFPKPAMLRQLDVENGGKASALFKSMSQLNDLDLFLNRGKATAKKRNEPAVKAPNLHPVLPEEEVFNREESMGQHSLNEQLNSRPMDYNIEKGSSEATDEGSIQHLFGPSAANSKCTQGSKVSGPKTVIVVNTQNFDKEMIMSRRSVYNKILVMEKDGTEVVERDIDLPVDVLINSAMCLAWYDCKTIRKNATTFEEASSGFRLCIENIATHVLTLLSFTFSGCILVFEGEINFLSAVMESSDGLYAAAAGLGIDLQIFCSYSSELTGEIILGSVLHTTKVSMSICPKMPESETLAESFLTKFPSINPLAAHAILSSGGTLIEFLEYSHERRILALQQHRIPEESISLFSALCKYGEGEDSKSALTDSLSSASSAANSNKHHISPHSERKRKKYVHSPPKMDICMDNGWQFQPVDKKDCWTPDVKEILDEPKQPIPHLAGFSGQKQKSNADVAVNSCSLPKPYDASRHSRAAKVMDKLPNRGIFLNQFLSQNQGSDASENRRKDFMGDIIDLTNSPSSDNESPSAKDSAYFPSWLREEDQDFISKPKAARKLAYGGDSLFSFPTASEINPKIDIWASFKDHGKSSSLDVKGFYDDDYNQLKFSAEDQSADLKEFPAQRSRAGSSVGLPPEETAHFGPASFSRNVHSETPMSRAIHSSEPQTSSPWTIEFLNGIRERSRLRKLSLQSNTSPAAPGYTIDVSKGIKRRSPSVIDFFKYQGGHTPDRRSGPMKQKPPTRSLSASRIGRVQASVSPIRTPIDRRAKQTLSFAKSSSGSQTKLVWTDGGVRRLNKKMRNQ
ncbi:unnamed protein product [Linum trigynum]|uniref:Protein SHORTAGE IN CHIASMATA 1 n=1 Tax=Linum trigynum TaxID=586398 RepID=A0AAV2G2W1_9ROSI